MAGGSRTERQKDGAGKSGIQVACGSRTEGQKDGAGKLINGNSIGKGPAAC